MPMKLDKDIEDLVSGGAMLAGEAYHTQARRNAPARLAVAPAIPAAEVAARYAAARADVEAHGPETLRELVRGTDALLERQTGWTPCQRAARMRSVVEAWDGQRNGTNGTNGTDGTYGGEVAPTWDLVVPLGTGSRHEDWELRMLLRSARANLRGLRTIHVIGPRRPGWLVAARSAEPGARSPEVRWHPWDQGKGGKDLDIVSKFLWAARCPEVSETFVGACDDWVFLQPSGPTVDWGAVQRGGVLTTKTDSHWDRAQAGTRRLLEAAGLPVKFYDTHTPSVMTRAGWEAVDRLPWREMTGGIAVWSLYHNVAGLAGPRIGQDGLASVGWHSAAAGATGPADTSEVALATLGKRFLCYNDAGLTPALRAWLEERFPAPAPWEAAVGAGRGPLARAAAAVGRVLGARGAAGSRPGAVSEIRIRVPWALDSDIGSFCNREMEACPPGGAVLLLDHDALMLTPQWYRVCLEALNANPETGLFTCRTNRGRHRVQRDQVGMRLDEDILKHLARARELAAQGAATLKLDTTQGWGVFMLVRQECWQEAGGFIRGFHGVDNAFFAAVHGTRWETRLLDGVYCYHAKLTTGPLAKAVPAMGPPVAASAPLPAHPVPYSPEPLARTGTVTGHPNSVPPEWPSLVGNHAAAAAAPSGPAAVSAAWPRVAVGVTCHGPWLRYLEECLAAIEAQHVRPAERYLSLDRCELSRQQETDLRARGWQIRIGDWGSPNPGRQWALESTTCPWIWHVDADDPHRPDYLAGALPMTGYSQVGIVHASREPMGGNTLWTPSGNDYWGMRLANYVDTSSLWRVHAAREAGGWGQTQRWDDWDLALRVTALGWQTMRNPIPSICRPHPDRSNRNVSNSDFPHKWARSYAAVALLAGRLDCWDDWSAAVCAADYPLRTHWHLVDNSRSNSFRLRVLDLAASLEGRGCRVTILRVLETFRDTGKASRHEWVAHLQNLVLPGVTEDVVLFWEDDVLPRVAQPVRAIIDHWDCTKVGGICAAYEARGHQNLVCAATGQDYWHGMPDMRQVRGKIHPGYGFLPGGFAIYNNALIRPALPFWVHDVPEGKMQGWDGQLSRCVRDHGFRLDLDGLIDCEHRWRTNP